MVCRINAKIIGAREHESHYGSDLLYNEHWHSTDTHGVNHVNFWILYVFALFRAALPGFEEEDHTARFNIRVMGIHSSAHRARHARI